MGAFGELLRKLRLDAGMGLRTFATLVGMQPSNLSSVENGSRGISDPAALREIADALGLTEGSPEWNRFFDAAKREGEFPADVHHLSDRKPIPALLRTIDNRQLSDREIRDLIKLIDERANETTIR